MESSVAAKCPLCKGVIRREEKAAPDLSADFIECASCGIYEIGRSTRAQLQTNLRDEAFIRALSSRIRPANEKGFVFRYPSGALIPGHPWLNGE